MNTIRYPPAEVTFNKSDLPSCTESPTSKVEHNVQKPSIEKKHNKHRCLVCNKKLGMMPFPCKCGVVTCIKHKWPEHQCTYDFRAEARKQLIRENPVVVAEKITRF